MGWLSSVTDAVSSAASAVGNAVEDAAGAVAGGAEAVAGAVVGGAEAVANTVESGIANAFSVIKDGVTDGAEWLYDHEIKPIAVGTEGIVEGAATLAEGIGQGLVEGVGNFVIDLEHGNIMDALNDLKDGAKEAFVQAPQDAWKQFSDVVNQGLR